MLVSARRSLDDLFKRQAYAQVPFEKIGYYLCKFRFKKAVIVITKCHQDNQRLFELKLYIYTIANNNTNELPIHVCLDYRPEIPPPFFACITTLNLAKSLGTSYKI